MAEGTPVEWTHRPGTIGTTLPLTMGCQKRSLGCDHCFAVGEVNRQQHLPGRAGLVHRTDAGVLDWTGKIALLPERLVQPLRWRVPHTVFVDILGELFDEQVPDAFIAAAWCVMHRSGQHQFLILSKCHARMRTWVKKWGDLPQRQAMITEAVRAGWITAALVGDSVRYWPAVLPNVELGVSVETQQWAEVRIHALVDTPAARRFVSAEPLLGPINCTRLHLGGGRYLNALTGDLATATGEVYAAAPGRIDQVIVGGETKKGARPMHPDWAREIRDQCVRSGTAFFFKQWGDFGLLPRSYPGPRTDRDDRDSWVVSYEGWHAHADDLWAKDEPADPSADLKRLRSGQGTRLQLVYKVGKKTAGAELDGREWRQFPT